jgi:hypothetical protein
MAIDNFTPTLWSTKLLVSLKKALIFGQPAITNRDYQGEITAQGDTVKINSIGSITISSYTKNSTITQPQEIVSAQTELVVDQADYFHFFVDDIDAAQNNVRVMGQAMQEAGYGLANTSDKFLAALLKGPFTGATAIANQMGTTGTPKTISAATDAYNFMVDLGVILDMANVPEMGRWIAVPPWFEGNLLKDDRYTRSLQSNLVSDSLVNGRINRTAGFDVLKSNNLPVGVAGAVNDYYYIFAGTNMALTAADQIMQMEAYRPELRFSDAVKGLHVYGGKLVRPEAVACLIVTRNA